MKQKKHSANSRTRKHNGRASLAAHGTRNDKSTPTHRPKKPRTKLLTE